MPVLDRALAAAHATLRAQAAVRWPTAVFDWRLANAFNNDAELQIRWVDGPSTNAVARLIHELPVELRYTIGSIRPLRQLGSAGREQVISTIETTYSITVARTASGDIDWVAAARRRIRSPLAELADSGREHLGSSYYNLAEIVRETFDRTDIQEAQ